MTKTASTVATRANRLHPKICRPIGVSSFGSGGPAGLAAMLLASARMIKKITSAATIRAPVLSEQP